MSTDQLRIFVSSTIKECSEERAVARKAVRSIGHQPILFEDIGARPHPPRDVYRLRLEESHIFVGIYKDNYGWIAPDMTISGVEDEFRLARGRGMDRLLYVHLGSDKRDPRLVKLLAEAENDGVVIAWYSDPAELHDRIRDDVTAVVSNQFVDQFPITVADVSPSAILDSVLPDPIHRLRRVSVEVALIEQIKRDRFVAVTGQFGIGKTVLVAQIATANEWLFVDARNKSTLDVVAHCANLLRKIGGHTGRTYTDIGLAVAALAQAWKETPDACLVIDRLPADLSLLEGLRSTLPVTGSGALIVCPAGDIAIPGALRFEIPTLTTTETSDLIGRIRGKPPEAIEVAEILAAGKGIPLYLRYFASSDASAVGQSLEQLELRAFTELTPQAREVICYLTVAGRPLYYSELASLISGNDAAIEGIVDALAQARILVRESAGSVDLVHDHLRQTIVNSISESSARHRFYATRVADEFVRKDDYVNAFLVLESVGEHQRANTILDRASFQASLRGGGVNAVPILVRKYERAIDTNDSSSIVACSLGLAQVYRQVGDVSSAAEALNKAKETASKIVDDALSLMIDEVVFDAQLEESGAQAPVQAIADLADRFDKAGDHFGAARAHLLHARALIVASDFSEAAHSAERARTLFLDLGDDYGVLGSEVNLASALSAIPSRRAEAGQITRKLLDSIDPQQQPRERSILCNILTRISRNAGQYQDAEKFAREAISIGESLGDHRVIAINQVNLGNVFRDQDRLDDALMQYLLAQKSAVDGHLPRKEADATEVIASLYNELENYSLALQYAQYAIGLAKLTSDRRIEIRALEEYGSAYDGLLDYRASTEVYISACNLIRAEPFDQSQFSDFAYRALASAVADGGSKLRIDILRQVIGHDVEIDAGLGSPLAQLCELIPKLADVLSPNALVYAIPRLLFDVLQACTEEVRRQVIKTLIRKASTSDADELGRCGLVLGVLLSTDWNCLQQFDLYDLAQELSDTIDGLYLKPYPDGALSWSIRIPGSPDLIFSAVQLSEDVGTSGFALALMMALRLVSSEFRKLVLSTEQLVRTESQVYLCSLADFVEHMGGPEALNEGSSEFYVLEPSDYSDSTQPEIPVVLKPNFFGGWDPSVSGASRTHIVLGFILRAVGGQFLGHEIDPKDLSSGVTRVTKSIAPRIQGPQSTKKV